MSSKIEVSRELLERVTGTVSKSYDIEDVMRANCELRSLLAAPVVERQPVAEYFIQACDKFDWTPEEALRFYADGKHFDTENGRTRILCSGAIASYALKNSGGDYANMKGAPPELAELQATIARLTAENERLEKEIDGANEPAGEDVRGRLVAAYGKGRWLMEYDALVAERDQFKADNERLKGGQGEPVALYPRCTILKECNTSASGYSLQPTPVSEGYKLVPLRPTPAMVEAGINTLCGDDEHQDYRDVYAAMIGAAP